MSKILYRQPIANQWPTEDPFLFCAYHLDKYPAAEEGMGLSMDSLRGRHIGQDFEPSQDWRMYHGSSVPGFPYHPHRGFETITINQQGVVDHTDSLGASGRFMGGDVQWMTAGKGLQHSEMFPLIHEDEENPLEIFQVWLNLPAKSKMTEPYFNMLWKEDIPEIVSENEAGAKTTIRIIAGNYNGTQALAPNPDSWANDPSHGVRILTAKLQEGASLSLHAIDAATNRNLYLYEGQKLSIDGEEIEKNYRVKLSSDAEIKITAVNGPAEILLLEGKPIGEPVAQYGPFVMNTQDEIREAMKDYGKTEFGGWPWPEREYAHAREKGRFASHADGRIEEK